MSLPPDPPGVLTSLYFTLTRFSRFHSISSAFIPIYFALFSPSLNFRGAPGGDGQPAPYLTLADIRQSRIWKKEKKEDTPTSAPTMQNWWETVGGGHISPLFTSSLLKHMLCWTFGRGQRGREANTWQRRCCHSTNALYDFTTGRFPGLLLRTLLLSFVCVCLFHLFWTVIPNDDKYNIHKNGRICHLQYFILKMNQSCFVEWFPVQLDADRTKWERSHPRGRQGALSQHQSPLWHHNRLISRTVSGSSKSK